MASIFLTGATGYIGGQVLHDLVRTHPEYTIAALIRDGKVAKHVTAVFPNVRSVIASLDDSDVIEEEASKADVVLRKYYGRRALKHSLTGTDLASNKHLGSFQAIKRGLAKRSSPSFWIQVSGASALAVEELSSPSFQPGQPSNAVFDDLDGIAEIRSLVRAHASRVVDNFLLDASQENPSIKTALVLPPIIYGAGEGPVNQRSVQVPTLCKVALERGKAIRLGKGEGRWGNIHVGDLGPLFVALAEAGAKGDQDGAIWGDNGIYLTGVGEIPWADISDRIAKAAHQEDLISTAKVEQIDEAEADRLLPAARVFFASNARSKSRRATKVLGWKPVQETLEADIPRSLLEEAERLGKAKI